VFLLEAKLWACFKGLEFVVFVDYYRFYFRPK
jgi:hypothetical protein